MSARPDLNIRHLSPAFRTFCGDRALEVLPRELARVGATRAVMICSPSVAAQAGPMRRLHEVLGDRLVGQFDGVEEHSPLPAVEHARALLQECGADAVIAVGGGSAVVTARAATILLAENAGVRTLCTQRVDGKLVSPKLSAPKLPQWVVPSSPTTAYAKAGAAVRDTQTGERLALYDPKARAQGVVLDPGFALTAPPRLCWSAALNAFSMAVEGLQSRHVDPLADALLAHALRAVVTWLPRVADRPLDAIPRLQLMLAAIMSGQGTDHTGGGLAQALSHAIGPRSQVANGVVEALLLPHAMRFNAPVVGDRLAGIADYLGLADRATGAVIASIENLLDEFGVPRRLRDVGVAKESLDEIVEHAMGDWAITAGPRMPEADDVREILRRAW